MELAVLMNNKAPGTKLLGELVVAANSGQTLEQIAATLAARDEFKAEYPLHQTPEEFGAEWVSNILPEADADLKAEAVKIVEAHINGGGSVPALVVAVQAFMSDPANADGALKTHIDNFSNKVAVATYHTITKEAAEEWKIPASVSSDAASVATGKGTVDTATAPPTPAADVAKVIALTKSTDVGAAFTGGGGDDMFNAILVGASAAGTTAQPGDSLKGGAGTDTLSVSVSGSVDASGDGADYTLQALSTEGIENVMYSNFNLDTNDKQRLDATLMTGVKTIGLSSSSAEGDLTVTGIKNLVDAEMRNGTGDLALNYAAAVVAGTADVQNLTVSASTGATFTANGVETINVTGELVKSSFADITGDKVKTITFAGDQNLSVTAPLTEKTLNASALTGNLTIEMGANAAHVVTGGSGDDTISSGTTLASTDTVDGGDGTDTLRISNAGTVNKGTAAAKGELYNVSGIEVIDFESLAAAGKLDVSNTGITTAKLGAALLIDVDNAVNSTAITISINGVDITSAATDGSATADEAGVLLTAAINANANFIATGADVDGTGDGVLVRSATGKEILQVTTGIAGGSTIAPAAYLAATVDKVTNEAVDIYAAGDVTVNLKDASGSDDSATINLKTVALDKGANENIGTITANNVETINMDVSGMTDGKTKTVAALTGNSVATLNLTGSSDTVFTATTGSNKLATINAGSFSGDLTLPAATAALNQTITTGTGNDTVAMGARLTAADTIDLGGNSLIAGTATTGGDTLTATGNIGSVLAASALNISNVEAYEQAIGAQAATYIDASNLSNVSSLAFSNDTNGGTVKLTNVASGQKIGLGIGASAANVVELGKTATVTLDVALADATGTEDSITLDYADGTLEANSVTLKTTGIETLNIAAPKKGSAVTSTLVNTNNAVSTINITSGNIAGTGTIALGTLNKATTTVNAAAALSKISVDTAATGAVNVSAVGAYLQSITTGTGSDTITLTSNSGTNAHTVNGVSGTGDTLNLTANSTSTDFTNVSNIDTINITVAGNTAAGVDDGTKDNGLNGASVVNLLGGDSLSTFTIATGGFDDDAAGTTMKFDASNFGGVVDLLVLGDAFDAELSILGGAAATDKVTVAASTATDNKIALMSGIETLVLNSTDTDADLDFDLTNVTGLKTVDAKFAAGGTADQIEIKKLPASVTKVKTTSTTTLDDLTIALASSSGAADALTVEITSQGTGHVLDLNSTGIETLNLIQKDADGGGVNLAGVTATTGSKTAVNVSGTGPMPLKALSSSINTVTSTGTGALTVAAADRGATAMTITGGLGGDSIAMENAADVLTGGLGTDTLNIVLSAILGGIQVDLSADDQVTTMNGGSNAAVQTGFENVDVSGYTGFGAVITGTAGANTITGTGSADSISGGKGNDILNGGVGTDVIDGGAGDDVITGGAGVDTITLGTGDNTVVQSGTIGVADHNDSITGFTITSDKLQFTGANIGDGNTTLTFTKAAAGSAAALSELNVFTTALANDAAVVTEIQKVTSTTPTLYLVYNNADASAQVWYDANSNVDGGEIQLMQLPGVAAGDLANVTGANFVELI